MHASLRLALFWCATFASGAAGTASFEPATPSVYVAKVKRLLTGAPVTAAEVMEVQKDRHALRTLVQQWLRSPQYLANRHAFFQQAFQQQPSVATAEIYLPTQIALTQGLLNNLHDSFANTVENAVDSGKPFNSVMMTHQFMMTTPMMAYYAMLDTLTIHHNNAYTSMLNPHFSYTFEADGPIDMADSLNPNNPNFMVWYDPHLYKKKANPADCYTQGRVVVDANSTAPKLRGQNLTCTLYQYQTGHPYQTWLNSGHGNRCFFRGTGTDLFTPVDYETWRNIKIRPPRVGESTTPFWDIAALRSSHELVLHIPRVSFFTTPSFFAQYPTNGSNQGRVITNQALIVGLNSAFEGNTEATPGMNMAALDTAHAPLNSDCYQCHQTLDPMRQYFMRELTYGYSAQNKPAMRAIAGWFDFKSVSAAGTDLVDFGEHLATHPSFAVAWATKLCSFANSHDCDPTDPELRRIAKVFQAHDFAWNSLVVELFTSPLVTYAAPTQTSRVQGETVSIARQLQLCDSLSARLGIVDVCGLSPKAVIPAQLAALHATATGLPSDQYSRGATSLPLVVQPGLIYRASLDNICATLATYLVDNGPRSRYQSTQASAAIVDMTNSIVGVTRQTKTIKSLLTGHFDRALAAGNSATTALQSTFMLACLSPSSIAIGAGL